MTLEKVDCVVIGAGVVGLACARELALAGRDVIVIEQAAHFGMETSSRNSEVIHAGIYYEPGSLKAKLCVAGKQKLYAYCAARNVPHANCGKLIVATSDDQIDKLERIAKRAVQNGAGDIQLLSREDTLAQEPKLDCVAALYSPTTGIIDSHNLMLSYVGDIENCGGTIVYHTPIVSGRICEDGINLNTGGEAPMTLLAKTVVNAAGLYAETVSRSLEGLDPSLIPVTHFAKGRYVSVSGPNPFDHLIYPAPVDGGLGVHVTFDLGGGVRLGPDVQWGCAIDDYSTDDIDLSAFHKAASRYWPDLALSQLHPDYAGLRPKLSKSSEPAADFCIQGPQDHRVPGLVNLYGIESPGLTASLAIGEYVRQLLHIKRN